MKRIVRVLRTTLTVMKGVATTALVLAAGATDVDAQCVQEALASFGPMNAYGFPSYYVDQSNLALEQCLDFTDLRCALTPPPDPGAPLDVATGNFFDEAPYSFVTADMTLPTGGRALLVMSVLGTWGNNLAAVIDGTQTVFSRVRFRIDTPQGGLYKITYPFGTATFNVAAGGRRSINFTDDCLVNIPTLCGQGVGRFFDTPLDPTLSVIATASHVGHFLVWDPSAPPAAPAGFVGDPAFLHKVVGSPCGHNFFRVEGPGLPKGGTQTDLFSVLGKRAVICGNGFVDIGEQCDDGNTDDGDCCSSSCQFEPEGNACDDHNGCTINETCNATGVCTGVAGPPPVCPTVAVEADTYVETANAKSKFGTASTLKADAKPIQQSFFQTRVTGLGAHDATSAKLRLFVTTASKKSGGQIHAIPCGGFDEPTTTYNNRPAIGTPVLDSLGKVAVKKTVEFEVGSALNSGDGLYCFALDSDSTTGVAYASRQAKKGKPELAVIEVDNCPCVP